MPTEPTTDLAPEVYARRRRVATRVAAVLLTIIGLFYAGYTIDHAGTAHAWVPGRVVETSPADHVNATDGQAQAQRGASRIEIPGRTFWREGRLERGRTVRVEISVGRLTGKTYIESVAPDSVADVQHAADELKKSLDETERTLRQLPDATNAGSE